MTGNKFTRGHADGLEGRAVYRGLAAGGYATIDFTGGVPSGAAAGSFTATAELTANFSGTSVAEDDHFSISGSLTNFMDVEEDDPLDDWTVALERINLVAGSASFGGGATRATFGQSTGTGSWEGAFFGNGRTDGKPGSVAGTFDAHLPAARIIRRLRRQQHRPGRMIRPVRPGSRAIAAGSQSFLMAKAPSPAVGLKTRRRTRPGRSPRRILGLGRCLVLACAFVFLWPHSAASGEPGVGRRGRAAAHRQPEPVPPPLRPARLLRRPRIAAGLVRGGGVDGRGVCTWPRPNGILLADSSGVRFSRSPQAVDSRLLQPFSP